MSRPTPRVAIIGSGFGGLGMGYYLRRAGIESFTIYEKAHTLGGVWRENTYPGAACDVPSHLYSFSFEPHYGWSCRYGRQQEILEYLHSTARKHGLLPHIRFGQELVAAELDEKSCVWTLRFATGEVLEADILISAVGQLHRPMLPHIPGRDSFRGTAFHSARWDHQFDFQGRTVAVIGTGASAVQFVPEIARQVRQLYVLQRSPGWVIPKIDRKFKPWERRLLDRATFLHDLDRLRLFLQIELINSALLGYGFSASLLKSWAERTLRAQIADPALRAKLTPDFPVGCKRILVSSDWLPALARSNVEVVTEAVAEITPTGLRTDDGKLREVDAIIYGTGFTATEFLAPMRIRGTAGRELSEAWAQGAQAYFGVAVAGFANFFMLYGPNTNLGAGSIVFMLERQQRYISRCIEHLQRHGLRRIEVRARAQQEFNERLQARSSSTAFEGTCHSWYKTAAGRNTNNWAGFCVQYERSLRRPRFGDYEVTAV